MVFTGRTIVIATKHEKEKTIAPVLEKEFGMKCLVPPNLDTDLLGTFSGEIERKDNPLETARKKCFMAMELTNCDFALASEDSFGPHPSLFFVPADDEIVVLIDKQNSLEIKVREISTETNFNGAKIITKSELLEFAKHTKFPSHALIMKKSKDDFINCVKGINDEEVLQQTFSNFIFSFGEAYIETDMRAMYNPSRMRVIEIATKKLVAKMKSLCPKCKTPGFSITDHKIGLPCQSCHFPTKSTLSQIYTCQKCNHIVEEFYPKNIYYEDPMYCDRCNP